MTEFHKNYERIRKQNDPAFKLLKTLRSRLGTVLDSVKVGKTISTRGLLGCDINFFKEYLEDKFTEGMTWKNHGEWHLDHIIPCNAFDMRIEMDQRVCFNWQNYQPLWRTDNLRKSNKFCEEDKAKFYEKITLELSINDNMGGNKTYLDDLKKDDQ